MGISLDVKRKCNLPSLKLAAFRPLKLVVGRLLCFVGRPIFAGELLVSGRVTRCLEYDFKDHHTSLLCIWMLFQMYFTNLKAPYSTTICQPEGIYPAQNEYSPIIYRDFIYQYTYCAFRRFFVAKDWPNFCWWNWKSQAVNVCYKFTSMNGSNSFRG